MNSEENHIGDINIIIQYYNDKDPNRQMEYDKCMEINLDNPCIKSIHDIIEESTVIPDIFLNHPKHVVHYIDENKYGTIFGRLTYQYAHEYANKTFADNEIIAILNLDIYLYPQCDAWFTIQQEFFDINPAVKVLCLSRHEIDAQHNIYKNPWSFKGYCQDAWVLRTPILPIKDCSFSVGNCWGCDNAYCSRLYNAGYKPFNYAEKYIICHFDICRGHVQNQTLIQTNKTDMSNPGSRDSMNICPFLPWEKLLQDYNVDRYLINTISTACLKIGIHTHNEKDLQVWSRDNSHLVEYKGQQRRNLVVMRPLTIKVIPPITPIVKQQVENVNITNGPSVRAKRQPPLRLLKYSLDTKRPDPIVVHMNLGSNSNKSYFMNNLATMTTKASNRWILIE